MTFTERVDDLRISALKLLDALEKDPPDMAAAERPWRRIASLWDSRLPGNRTANQIDRTGTMNVNTLRTYSHAIKEFESWCIARGIVIAAQSVVRYMEWMLANEYAPQTITVRVNAISRYQKQFGMTQCTALPEVKQFLSFLRSKPGNVALVPLVHLSEMKAMLQVCAPGAQGWRDRVVLLLLWELRPIGKLNDLCWDQITRLPDGTVQIQLRANVPPVEIPPTLDTDFCLDVALMNWENYAGSEGQVLRALNRSGNRLGKNQMMPLGGTGVIGVLRSVARRAGLPDGICVRSFRRATVISHEAIARVGKKVQAA